MTKSPTNLLTYMKIKFNWGFINLQNLVIIRHLNTVTALKKEKNKKKRKKEKKKKKKKKKKKFREIEEWHFALELRQLAFPI